MRRVVLAVVCTVAGLVLLLSFKTHPTAAVAAPPSAVSPSSQSTDASGARTVTGAAADTRYGPVQVRITLTGGKVTGVTAVEYPTTDPRDQEINAYAIPVLNREATQAGDAGIDVVSGATYTSQGYLESLQSALDRAGVR